MTRWAIAVGIALVAGVCVAQNQQGWFSQTLLMQPRKAASGDAPLGLTGLIAHYLMNDNAANTNVLDNTGSYIGGMTVNSSTRSVPGRVNRALHLNGTNEEIRVPHNDVFSFGSNNWTICLWYFVPSTTVGTKTLVGKANGLSYYPWRIEIASGKIYLLSSAGSSWNLIDGTTLAFSNSWQHVAVRRSGNSYYIYTNGAQSVTGVMDWTLVNNANPITMGHLEGYAQWFDGELDDVRFYTNALSTNAISLIYNGGNGTEAE